MTAEGPGEAVSNAEDVATYAVGYCLQFVRLPCWEVGSLYPSAIDAWDGAKHRHPGDRNPPKGAPCFYRGGNYGHAVIAIGGGRIRSTDSPTSGQVNDQPLDWPEVHWGYEYLGWSEDLNGVTLPGIGDDDTMALSEDDLEAIAHRVNQVLGDYTSKGKPQDTGDAKPQLGDQRLKQIQRAIGKLD